MQPADCIIMTERKDAVDFLATRDKIVEAIDSAYARGLDDGRKEAANIPADSIMLPGGRVVPMAPQDDGQPSRLCVTHDGFVVGINARLWRFNKASGEMERFEAGWIDRRSGRHPIAFEVCYSTRAAAEAAKEKP